MIKEAWEMPNGNYTIPLIPSPFHFADRDDIKQMAVYRVSYLARLEARAIDQHKLKAFNVRESS
tara:strand:- start:17638 stop:17829 length:192 start_codon:yes stop_codon:yes gene_type:complete